MKDVRLLEDSDELNVATDCGEIYGLSSLPNNHHQSSTLGVCAGYSMNGGQHLLYRNNDNVVITMSRPTKPLSHVESFEKFREGFAANLDDVQRVEEKAITIITSRKLMMDYIKAKGQLPADCVVFDFWHISAVVMRVKCLRGLHRQDFLREHFSGLTLTEPGDAEDSEEESEEESDDAQ